MGFLDQPQRVWWRKAFFQMHLWIGVLLGAYLVAICLSGSLLVFEPNLLNDTPQLPHAAVQGPATWNQMVAVALHAYPDATLADIDMRSANRRVAPIGLRLDGETQIVYVDSFTNRIAGSEVLERRHAVVEFTEALHNQLALGVEGGYANGIGGALLFVMTATGLVLWWPGKRNWKRGLKVQWRARWARLNWDLHSAFGFWCFVLVAMWGITGAYFIFPRPFDQALQRLCPMPAARQLPSSFQPGEPVLTPDDFIARAKRIYPGSKLAYFYMDTSAAHGEVQVYLSPNPSIPMPLLEDEIVFQPTTGAVLMQTSSAHWNWAERLSISIYSIHFGNFGGWPVQVLWALLGLVPVLLVVTGYVMWWNRVLKKKWVNLKSARR